MEEIRAFRSKEYKNWYNSLTSREKRIIDSRIDVAREQGLLIKIKKLDSNFSLYEFKWDSGMRVYFSLLKDLDGNFMLLLVGGNKNSQSDNIAESKKIIKKAVGRINYKEKKKQEKKDE